jgi:hypothetical protein
MVSFPRSAACGVITAIATGLAGCGGGGGGTTPAPPSTPPPPATVSASVAPSYVSVGGQAMLAWSSTNASNCAASGAWSGAQAATGNATVSQSSAGIYKYTIQCSGSQGSVSSTALLVVNNVLASSYENKNNRNIGSVTLPNPGGNAFALADFNRDGSNALVVHSLEYNPADPTTYSKFGHIHFYKQDGTGAWIENTSALLANNVGCLHPRKAIIADFNNDGVPDVFFACHGADAPPFPGEQPHVLLSQNDGTYQNVTLPLTCYCHSASAADINGDGFPDVLVTDTSVALKPFFLINNQNGTFTPDYFRLPASVAQKQIYTAELIDFKGTGHFDVFLGGNEPGTTSYPASEFSPTIFPNDGTGNFISTTPTNLLLGPSYGLALDVLFINSNIYLLKVNPAYTGSEIQKIAYPTLTAQSVIYSHNGVYSTGSSWIDWIIDSNGQIDSENATFGVSVPQ